MNQMNVLLERITRLMLNQINDIVSPQKFHKIESSRVLNIPSHLGINVWEFTTDDSQHPITFGVGGNTFFLFPYRIKEMHHEYPSNYLFITINPEDHRRFEVSIAGKIGFDSNKEHKVHFFDVFQQMTSTIKFSCSETVSQKSSQAA